MNTNPFSSKTLLAKACDQLGLGDGYQITYAATHVAHLVDVDDVTQLLDDTFIRMDEVEMAVNDALNSVKLPQGTFLVGVQKADGSDKPKYTFVTYESRKVRQFEILQWANATFGEGTASNRFERVRRFAEESIELAQAIGLSKLSLIELIDHVYDKPIGDIEKEIGQCGVALLALAEHMEVNADYEERKEFERIISLPADHWQARHNAKADKGIALASTAEK